MSGPRRAFDHCGRTIRAHAQTTPAKKNNMRWSSATAAVLLLAVLLQPPRTAGRDDGNGNFGSFLLSGSNLVWPSAAAESDDVRSGRYDPRKILVRGIQMVGDRAFVSMPRLTRTGVPWTLGTFRLDAMDFEPDIRPYPLYEHHYQGRGGGGGATTACMVNVVDVFAEGGVLWALDAGTTNEMRRPARLGPAQLVAVNLTTDAVIGATDLSAVTRPGASVLEHVVAVRTACGRLYVYVSDAGRHAIVVYDAAAGRLHTVPVPETVSAAHHRRVSLHMVPVGRAGRGYVYFTYRQSGAVFALDAWSPESVAHGSVSAVPGAKPVDMHVLGSDRGTTVYFRTDGAGAADVWAWDVNRPLDARSFRLVHRGYMRYLAATAVVAGWRDVVWSLESNYAEFAAGAVDCTGPRTLLRPLRIAGDCCADGDGDYVS